jgi:hypothetical protein
VNDDVDDEENGEQEEEVPCQLAMIEERNNKKTTNFVA